MYKKKNLNKSTLLINLENFSLLNICLLVGSEVSNSKTVFLKLLSGYLCALSLEQIQIQNIDNFL